MKVMVVLVEDQMVVQVLQTRVLVLLIKVLMVVDKLMMELHLLVEVVEQEKLVVQMAQVQEEMDYHLQLQVQQLQEVVAVEE